MATKKIRDAVLTHATALFAGDARVASPRVVLNDAAPEPPKTLAELGKLHVFLDFPPTVEGPSSLGDVAWSERGAFMFHAAVQSGTGATGQALADEIVETYKASLRNRTIPLGSTDGIDIYEFTESEAGSRWNGNWWGISLGVAFFLAG